MIKHEELFSSVWIWFFIILAEIKEWEINTIGKHLFFPIIDGIMNWFWFNSWIYYLKRIFSSITNLPHPFHSFWSLHNFHNIHSFSCLDNLDYFWFDWRFDTCIIEFLETYAEAFDPGHFHSSYRNVKWMLDNSDTILLKMRINVAKLLISQKSSLEFKLRVDISRIYLLQIYFLHWI
jgi:hypothetical protein